MIKVVFIINSTRKLSDYAQKVLLLAEKSGELIVKICKTEYKNHATEIALSESTKNDVLIAVGGDGTYNEVVNGIYASTKKDVLFGIIPNGTGNDFSRMLKHSTEEDFVGRLENKQSNLINLGTLEFNNSRSVFLNIADLGFGVKVLDLMSKQRSSGIKGKLSYGLAIVRAFFTYKKNNVSLKGDDFIHNGKVLMVAFCNGTTFGYGLTINPMASLTSNNMEITVIGNVSLLTYAKYLNKLKKGIKIIHPEVQYYQSKQIDISNLASSQLIEADGEILGIGIQKINTIKAGINIINQLK